jgi:uncharacterized membrane protein YkvA (DUF1232 family)
VPWWSVVVSVVSALLIAWAALVVALWLGRPGDLQLTQIVRLLPDLLRLVRRLAADRDLPTGVRVRLVLLLAYLAFPVDLVPDFVPVVGYADDAVVVALVLRSVVKHAGPAALERHWPGTPEGLRALRLLVRT